MSYDNMHCAYCGDLLLEWTRHCRKCNAPSCGSCLENGLCELCRDDEPYDRDEEEVEP